MPTLHGTKDLTPLMAREPLSLDQESLNSSISMQEQTKSQVALFTGPYSGSSALETTSAANSGIVALGQMWHTANYPYFMKVREMRRHPTISIVRNLSNATMATAKWSVETMPDAPEHAKDIISDLLPFQNVLMTTLLPNLFDWGWAGYEKVFQFNQKDQRTKLRRLKPLLQDYTRIMVTAEHGKFAGFKQFNKFLSTANSLLFFQNMEGGYYYGEGTIRSIEPAYDRWRETDRANVQYDKKICGAHWVVHYPMGKSLVAGVSTDNFQLAENMLKCLESSGSIAVPNNVMQATVDLQQVNQVGQPAWQVEILSAPPGQADFNIRLTYLDTLMVRGGGFPERSILEGQYGTKAEAGEHADFAVAHMDWRNKHLADLLNWHLCNQLLRLNLGAESENTAWIKPAQIADDKKDFMRQVFLAALSNPTVASQQYAGIDMHAMRDQLELPQTDQNDEGDESLNNMLELIKQQTMQDQQPIPPDVPPDQVPPNQAMMEGQNPNAQNLSATAG